MRPVPMTFEHNKKDTEGAIRMMSGDPSSGSATAESNNIRARMESWVGVEDQGDDTVRRLV